MFKDFLQSFTLVEGITIILSLTAIIITVVNYFTTGRRNRRQLRIGRLEEMIEIIHVLMGDYHYFYDAFSINIEIQNKKNNDENIQKNIQSRADNYSQILTKISKESNLQNKLIRLTVLANTYLPNKKLRNKIRSFVGLYTCLAETTLFQNYNRTKEIYHKYPEPWILLPYVEKIQSELIKEMKLGYNNNFFAENSNDEQFRKELNI